MPNIAHQIRHYERRIIKMHQQANRAYKNQHNIIAIDCLNRAMNYEIKLNLLKGLLNENPGTN